jgi:hypothetical protein
MNSIKKCHGQIVDAWEDLAKFSGYPRIIFMKKKVIIGGSVQPDEAGMYQQGPAPIIRLKLFMDM